MHRTVAHLTRATADENIAQWLPKIVPAARRLLNFPVVSDSSSTKSEPPKAPVHGRLGGPTRRPAGDRRCRRRREIDCPGTPPKPIFAAPVCRSQVSPAAVLAPRPGVLSWPIRRRRRSRGMSRKRLDPAPMMGAAPSRPARRLSGAPAQTRTVQVRCREGQNPRAGPIKMEAL